ncbi:MAG TPA: hypothetical protein VLC12_05620 [Terriglobales bacterium]|nr:hypothetical protein [Terriglobales bacterium]
MKKFLAGLGLALAAAVILTRQGAVRPAARKQPARGKAKGPVPESGAGLPVRRTEPERKSAPQPIRTASPANAPGRPADASGGSRSAEDVLNSATRQQLLSVYGIGPVLADRIIQNRPYAAAYDVVEQGIIPESLFVQLRKQLLDQHSA